METTSDDRHDVWIVTASIDWLPLVAGVVSLALGLILCAVALGSDERLGNAAVGFLVFGVAFLLGVLGRIIERRPRQ